MLAMRTGFVFLLIWPLVSSAQDLSNRLQALSPGQWLSYEVELQAGQQAPCCFNWNDKRVADAACRLDQRNWNFGTRDSDPIAPPGSSLRVLLRRGANGIDRVRAVAATCAVDTAGETVIEAGEMRGNDSVAVLDRFIVAAGERDRSYAMGAISSHADPGADAALERYAAPAQDEDLRRDAVFWLAQARGERGFRAVRDLLERERDEDIRRHEVFAISVSKAAGANDELRRLTRHASSEVRGEAIFWLAQSDDPEVEARVHEMLARETDEELRDKAIFALSQLPAERAIPALRALVEGDGPRQVRKQAIFWLAQVDDDAVLPVFDELLGERNGR